MSRLNCSEIKVLAALTVRDKKLESSNSGVKYDPDTGVVTIPNVNNSYSIVPVVTNLASEDSEHYITSTHFIRQLSSDGLTNQFRVWRTTLDTSDRNSPPGNFSAIIIGIK